MNDNNKVETSSRTMLGEHEFWFWALFLIYWEIFSTFEPQYHSKLHSRKKVCKLSLMALVLRFNLFPIKAFIKASQALERSAKIKVISILIQLSEIRGTGSVKMSFAFVIIGFTAKSIPEFHQK